MRLVIGKDLFVDGHSAPFPRSRRVKPAPKTATSGDWPPQSVSAEGRIIVPDRNAVQSRMSPVVGQDDRPAAEQPSGPNSAGGAIDPRMRAPWLTRSSPTSSSTPGTGVTC